jgi:hypothetical protein
MKKLILTAFAFALWFGSQAQQTADTMFVHKGQFIYEFSTAEVDSIIFYRTQETTLFPKDTIFIVETDTIFIVETDTIFIVQTDTIFIVQLDTVCPAFLIVDETPITATAEGGTYTIIVNSDREWTVVVEDAENKPWCTLTKPNDSTIMVHIAENTLFTIRHAIIKITVENLTKSVAISQDGVEGLCSCIMDTLKGEWSWYKTKPMTYDGFTDPQDNEFKSILRILSQNADESINYEVFVEDTLFYSGSFQFQRSQSQGGAFGGINTIKLPHRPISYWSIYFGCQDPDSEVFGGCLDMNLYGSCEHQGTDILIFMPNHTHASYYYYEKIKNYTVEYPIEIPFTRYMLDSGWISLGWNDPGYDWGERPCNLCCTWTNLNYPWHSGELTIINSDEELENHISCRDANYQEIDFSKHTLLLVSGNPVQGIPKISSLLLQRSKKEYKLEIEIIYNDAQWGPRWVVALVVNKLSEESIVELNITFPNYLN